MTRFSFTTARVLAVVAHPDDAELLCAGTLARAAADGAVIGICVLCQGDKGQTDPPTSNLKELRRTEMQRSADLLGAELHHADVPDGQLFDDLPTRMTLINILRAFRPTLVLSHSIEDYHADHSAAGTLTRAASWFCASPGHVTDHAAVAQPPELWSMDHVNLDGFNPHFLIDISAHVDLKKEMLRCHASQLNRAGQSEFAPLRSLMERQYSMRGAQAGVMAAEAFRTDTAWKRRRAW